MHFLTPITADAGSALLRIKSPPIITAIVKHSRCILHFSDDAVRLAHNPNAEIIFSNGYVPTKDMKSQLQLLNEVFRAI